MTTAALHGDLARFDAAFRRVASPAEDRRLSPFTGLTRDHWVAAADELLLSVDRYRTPGGARFDLPGTVSQQGVATDGLEAFARTFLLAAFLWVGNRGEDPHGHLARYVEGVRTGTRTVGADDPDSWPAIDHIGRHGQPHVEAASIALSLHLTREASWDTLNPEEQDRVAAWLRGAIDREPSSNNWYLFPLTIASFLESVGRQDEQTSYVIARGLALIELWYRGEGWYSDGEARSFDHYVGWALHFYPVLHARLRGDDELSARLLPRLSEFLVTFAPTFDRNGAPLHQGRSLTYRMATLAAIAMGEVTGATPLSHGQSRRILSSCLRYFLERGALVDGILNLGWHGPFEPIVQRYSGPGSPYWASKGFAALMLPADHPLWTSVEEELPADRQDLIRVIEPVAWLLQTTTSDGIVRVLNQGSSHLKPHEADAGAPDPLYARFAYSTRTGPTVLHNPSDNDVQVQVRGVWSVRRQVHPVGAGTDWLASWHGPRFTVYSPFDASPAAATGPVLPSARIDSISVARGDVEVRIHRLVGIPPRTPIRLSGWAVAASGPERLRREVDGALVRLTAEVDDGELLRSELLALHGLDRAASSTAPSGTAFGPWAVVPELLGQAADGILPTTIVAAAVRLTGNPEARSLAQTVGLRVDGTRIEVDWAEGPGTSLDLVAMDWPQRP
jgi:hypothetical protein